MRSDDPNMFRLTILMLLIAVLAAGCSGADGDPGKSPFPTSTSLSPDLECLHSSTAPFRSMWRETAQGYQSQVLREIDGDTAQWILTFPVSDELLHNRTRAQIIIDDEVWNLEGEEWKTFPVVPARWPLLVWVNGHVSGALLVDNLVAGERDVVAGIETTIYHGDIAAMTAAVPRRMLGREFVEDGTSFTYWVDDCHELLRADVVIELGGEEREIAESAGLPASYRYDYIVYDVGADFDIAPPEPGFLPEIPLPSTG